MEAERPTVLIVDDDPSVRMVSRAMLEEAGYQVLSADGGEQAIELLRQYRGEVGAVMLDMTMPGISGEDTFRQLRDIRSDLPVLCFSGYGDAEGSRWIADKPQTSFIAKPFTLDSLRKALRKTIGSDPETT